VAIFRGLVPSVAPTITPYLQFLLLFALGYTAFKLVEVLVLDLLPMGRDALPRPAILRDIMAALVAALIVVVLLRSTFGVDVTALVATSAALSIILGLALQETLSNLFAGLALMIDRPFDPGDWVRIDQHIGCVKEISWRAVKIQLLRQEDYLIIPNSVIGKTQIVNISQPTPIHGHEVTVGVVYGEPPNRVRQVLREAALEVPRVLREPAPRVELARFEGYSVLYRLTFWIADFASLRDIEGEVLAHTWYALRRHGIRIPFPITDLYWHNAARLSAEERRDRRARLAGLLRGVDFLEALTAEELERLADDATVAPYPVGLAVFQQGEPGDSLFVIVAGQVEVMARPEAGGPERSLATLGTGDYFGELSLLTGAPRSATVRAVRDTQLLVITKEALRPILVVDPSAAERLSRTLARRQEEQRQALEQSGAGAASPEGAEALSLLGAIRGFFGLL
jgi:small-conductance mechanosensitive channel